MHTGSIVGCVQHITLYYSSIVLVSPGKGAGMAFLIDYTLCEIPALSSLTTQATLAQFLAELYKC